LNLSRNYRK